MSAPEGANLDIFKGGVGDTSILGITPSTPAPTRWKAFWVDTTRQSWLWPTSPVACSRAIVDSSALGIQVSLVPGHPPPASRWDVCVLFFLKGVHRKNSSNHFQEKVARFSEQLHVGSVNKFKMARSFCPPPSPKKNTNTSN